MRFLFKPLISALFLLFFMQADAQDSALVKWQLTAQQQAANSFNFILQATVSNGWHVYAGPDAVDGLSGLVIKTSSAEVKLGEPVFSPAAVAIKDPIFESRAKSVFSDSFTITVPVSITGTVPPLVKLNLSYEVANQENFIPEEAELEVNPAGGTIVKSTARIRIPTIDLKNPIVNFSLSSASASPQDAQKSNLWTLFALGFFGGLIALLTPCVFPMIPLTVSFFTKKSGTRKSGVRNAVFYGFFIFLIYVLLSLPFHFLDSLNPEILNNISTNVYLNVFFFVVFIVFALSFFGLFEITLPASFSTGADSKASAGNLLGIFFMALTLALVSFSCTGPILGSLLAGSLSSNGGAMQLTSGMAGFGLALALPFALFALFPQWLNSLPKSGGWLTTVKIVLGFAEVALAFKFLSNADLVMHWGLLKREIFIGIWVLTGALLTLYLFNIIKFKHEGPVKKLSTVRIILAIITGLFTLYLVPGLTNTRYANLKLISGFPPPLYYSIYHTNSDCILSLTCTHDYEEGLRLSKAQNKPMLIDFTGYACVNCRRMEENVWSTEEVYPLLRDSFIVVSLYVDDKRELPLQEQFVFISKDGSKKKIESVGDKWAAFETENFANNAQPWYALLNSDELLLTHPVGYVPDKEEYAAWLRAGLKGFYKK